MELEDRTFLEKRLGFLRRELQSLGKFGMSETYYMEHLDSIIRECKYIGNRLKMSQAERLFDAKGYSVGSTKNERSSTLDSRDKRKRRISPKKSVGK